MPTKSSKASTNSKPKSQAKRAPTPTSSRTEQARAAAQSAVEVPVGAVLALSDRVLELVKQATGEARKTRTGVEQRVRKAADQLAALR